jgi:Predicted membrane protein
MVTLILNIDRDNDYGDKAHIVGPLVGYSQCYNAAVKLITADPEDSDANALFGALKHYEMLQSKGEDVEIALVTGDEEVGERSDEIISGQLDQVFTGKNFDNTILISDGAEDDYVMPLILSRTKIRYVKHILVRHNQNIESLYYYIVKAMKDKKLVKKFAIPIGIILLVYGITVLSFLAFFDFIGKVNNSPSLYAYTLVIIAIGAYSIERGFDIKEKILKVLDEVKAYSEQARVMFISTLLSIGIVLVGIASTYSILYGNTPALERILLFFEIFSIWAYASLASRALFKIADIFIEGNSLMSNTLLYAVPFSLSAELTFIGILGYLRYSLKFVNLGSGFGSVILILLGISIALITAGVHKKKTSIYEQNSVMDRENNQ